MQIDIKGAIALLVIVGSFALIGVYALRNESPDVTVVAMISTPVGAVIGFYFGHINGAATQLATQTTALAAQALAASTQRRGGDPPVVTAPALVVPAPPAAGPSGVSGA